MAKGWRYILANAKTMEVMATFKQCKSRTLSVDINRSGSASGAVSMNEQGSDLIWPWSTALIVQRDDVALWSGLINGHRINMKSGMVSFNAVGWFDRLMHLQIQDPLVQYTDKDAGYIVQQLLLLAKQQDANIPITIGTVQPSQLRTVTYTRGYSIGQAIMDLVELEAGFDWTIDPVTRKFNVFEKRMADRIDCQWNFVFDDARGKPSPQSNLEDVDMEIDGNIVNDMRPIGAGGQVNGITDAASQDEYGVFQESPTMPQIVDNNILVAYGQAEVAFRSEPHVTFTMTPKTTLDATVPRLGKDFDIGDITYLTVRRGWVQSIRMPQRIFGASLSISDTGDIETLTNLQTRAS